MQELTRLQPGPDATNLAGMGLVFDPEASENPVVVFDGYGSLISMNQPARELGVDCEQLSPTTPDLEPYEVELGPVAAPLVIEGIPVRVVLDGERAIAVILRDITARKRSEDVLAIQCNIGHAFGQVGDAVGALCRLLTIGGIPGADCGALYVRDRNTDGFVLIASEGVSKEFRDTVRDYSSGSPELVAIREGIVMFPDTAMNEGPWRNRPWEREGLKSITAVPVRTDGRTAAFLVLGSHGRDLLPDFTDQIARSIASGLRGVVARISAEVDRRVQEEQFRAVANYTYDWESWIDERGHYVYVSPSCERISGYRPVEFVSDPDLMRSIIHPDDAPIFARHLERLAHGSDCAEDFRIIAASGETRWISHVCQTVYGDDGRLIGRRSSNRDITDRQASERDHQLLSTAIEQTVEAVVITDTNARIRYVNPAFCEVTGYQSEEVIGQFTRILKSGQHDQAFYEDLWKTLTTGERWHGRFRNRRKDGTIYEEESVISPVRDSSGQITNYVKVGHDVTQQVELEAQLRQAQKMEAVGRLAGGVAHDFNNLLTAIVGNVELFKMESDDQTSRNESIDEIGKAATKATSLTRQLLTFSRKVALKPDKLELNAIIADLEKLLRRIIGEHIVLSTESCDDLWHIQADAGQIEQIILNLVVNARDAMPEGGEIVVSTANVSFSEEQAKSHAAVLPGDYAMFSVTDTGCGMDESTRERVFEPFFTTKKEEGTGLGLATVYGVIRQHGGAIWCHSTPGEGTRFDVCFPAVDAPAPPRTAEVETSGIAHGTETVLVLDDDPGVLRVTSLILKRHGYTVVEAKNGHQAIDLFEQNSGIDLLLVDVVLPDISGRVVAERLTASDPDLKVLYASGYTDDELAQHGVTGADVAFTAKPFHMNDLLREVRDVIDG
jgi:two-component system, cell cycle sensor histidine kinase and response regulator CckA